MYGGRDEDGRIFIKKEAFYNDENKAILANGLFPRPCYIVMVNDEQGHSMAEAVSLGHLQSSEPALHVPLQKAAKCTGASGRQGNSISACLPLNQQLWLNASGNRPALTLSTSDLPIRNRICLEFPA